MSEETLKQLDDAHEKMQMAEKAYQEALETYIAARVAQYQCLVNHNNS